LPVEQVSWEDAVEFCARLSQKTGKTYRLPTEAEWEYAARAGTTTPFAFGETITPEIANYDGNYPYGSASKGEYRKKTVEVGSLGVANAFGLYDMHGNVWEWCADWYSSSYYEECRKQGVVSDPQGPSSGSPRVIRGGGWIINAVYCRSAYRNGNAPGARYDNVGFRLVRVGR
jgi:formylglycine-generating enzyme required for sulfatase activity